MSPQHPTDLRIQEFKRNIGVLNMNCEHIPRHADSETA